MKTLKKIGKWAGIVVGVLATILLIAYIVVYFKTESRINKKYIYNIPELSVPTDSISIARGEHVYHIRGCVDCHGTDLSGKIYMDNPMLLSLTVPNLTRGRGGLTPDFGIQDWVRVLKHGVGRGGRSLWVMPSHEAAQMTKNDMADLIAYCITRPPVNSYNEKLHSIGPIGRIVIALNQAVVLPAEKINHAGKLSEQNLTGISVSSGKYLSVTCQGCHRENLQGGGPLAPGYPDVPDITTTGEPGKWSPASFIKTIRSGITPEGRKLRSEYMPWPGMNHFSDQELESIFLYLKTLPEKK